MRIFILCLALVSPCSLLAQERQWYKGNTHTHTLWSDGNDFPDRVVDWYASRDYQFLALSDHNILSRGERWIKLSEIEKRRVTLGKGTLKKYKEQFGSPWVETRGGEGEASGGEEDGEALEVEELEVRLKTLTELRKRFEKPGEFLLIEAEEITDKYEKVQIHINAINVSEVIPPQKGRSPRETMRNNLRAVQAQEERTGEPILAHLNHPNFQWSLSAEDLAQVVEEQFFEVYNGHPSINHLGRPNKPGDEKIWDIANTIRLVELQEAPLYALATDDSHHYHGGDASPGRGWVMVHAESLSARSLIQAMREGAFYASSGVRLEGLQYGKEAKGVRFEIVAEPGVTYKTEIFGTKQKSPNLPGESLAVIEGTLVDFSGEGDELYLRATVTSSKKHPNPSYEGQMTQAWTQPIGWKAGS